MLSDELLRQTYLDAAVIEQQRLKDSGLNLDSRIREIDCAGLRAVANLAASQPREAAPSDSDRALWETKPDGSIGPTEHGLDVWNGRTSHPVQVEVTDDMVERAARAADLTLWYRKKMHPMEVSQQALTASLGRARAALAAALGGGK